MKKVHIKNDERGAALWSVLVIIFIILFVVTYSFSYLIEHRTFIHMRLQQIQASELVQNGVAVLKNYIDSTDFENLKVSSFAEYYETGSTEIRITEVHEDVLQAVISGLEKNGAVQSYKVHIELNSNRVIYFIKTLQ